MTEVLTTAGSRHRGTWLERVWALFHFLALAQVHRSLEWIAWWSLLDHLRACGYVIVMRHASSPRAPPDFGKANVGNVQRERQLDEAGRSSAREFGAALRQLHIPVWQVLSSPTYRALETLRLAGLGPPKTFPQLGDSGQSMQADPSGVRAAWLRTQAAQVPPHGQNALIVTHFPNIVEAFGQRAADLADGEALIMRPDGQGHSAVVERVKIDEWAHPAGVN
jgi:phosphohistidine phosphatase SixA